MNDVKQLKIISQKKKQQQYLLQKLHQLKEQEEKYSKFNLHKLQIKWRDIIRQLKSKELKNQVEINALEHEKEVDRKNSIINMMWRDLHESEEQYRLALRTHQNHMDSLIHLQEKRVRSMEIEFRRGLAQFKAYFDEEMSFISEMQNEQFVEIRDIIKELEDRERDKDKEIEKDFSMQSKSITSKYKNDYHVMKIDMEEIAERKRKQYQQENEEFGRPIYQSYRDFEDLRKENEKYEEEIKSQLLKIRRDEDQLSQWKRTWLANQAESDRRNLLLQQEIKTLKSHINNVKKQLQQFRDQESTNLKEMITLSNETSKILQEHIEQAERIISNANLNKKHETQLERTNKLETSLTNEDDKVEDTPENKEFLQLGKFYSQYNKVLMDKMALEQEKDHLLADNNKLRMMLKSYLDGISVNEDVLKNSNPLIIVEQIQTTPQNIVIQNRM